MEIGRGTENAARDPFLPVTPLGIENFKYCTVEFEIQTDLAESPPSEDLRVNGTNVRL